MSDTAAAVAKQALAALIARLETASEGSRELDAEIGRACRVEPKIKPVRSRTHFIGGEAVKLGDKEVWPSYTTSLDAALTLVPEGMTWVVNTGCPPCQYRAEVDYQIAVWAKTAVLALCIAALKARAA